MLSGSVYGLRLHKKITCAMLAHSLKTTFKRKITHKCCIEHAGTKYCQANVVQICLRQHCTRKLPVQCCLEQSDMLSKENRLFEVFLVACFLTGYTITKQSWLFLVQCWFESSFTAYWTTMNRCVHWLDYDHS